MYQCIVSNVGVVCTSTCRKSALSAYNTYKDAADALMRYGDRLDEYAQDDALRLAHCSCGWELGE